MGENGKKMQVWKKMALFNGGKVVFQKAILGRFLSLFKICLQFYALRKKNRGFPLIKYSPHL